MPQAIRFEAESTSRTPNPWKASSELSNLGTGGDWSPHSHMQVPLNKSLGVCSQSSALRVLFLVDTRTILSDVSSKDAGNS